MQSLAVQMGASAQETHVVNSLNKLTVLKTLNDMAGDRKQDAALWQKYIDESTRMLRLAAHTIQTQPAIQKN